ncbi:DUF6249 domain-containing protein [Mucilaginibacter antarcticus]|uniref:DUF6249 domain-containing protein n=1 Tax=Mucilaginibacter antarcticus TaxID=1855725 RepID=A0ABW5XIL5_9SPHI
MQEVTRDAIVSITLFAAVFGMVYVFLMTRHRERMAILERNLTSVPFPITNFNHLTLKYGLLLIGLGVGFLMGTVLESLGMKDDIAYLSMILIFGGVGLIVSYLIIQTQKK